MTTDEVRARVAEIVGGIDVPLGVHAHQNLSLAVANSIAAVRGGRAQPRRLAAPGSAPGAGNCPTEILAAVCEKNGIVSGRRPAQAHGRRRGGRPARSCRASRSSTAPALLLGYAGVYGSFLLHAQRAAERYGVSQADILLELGRRKVVGGQEDMIIDVAVELARKHAAQEVTA